MVHFNVYLSKLSSVVAAVSSSHVPKLSKVYGIRKNKNKSKKKIVL